MLPDQCAAAEKPNLNFFNIKIDYFEIGAMQLLNNLTRDYDFLSEVLRTIEMPQIFNFWLFCADETSFCSPLLSNLILHLICASSIQRSKKF